MGLAGGGDPRICFLLEISLKHRPVRLSSLGPTRYTAYLINNGVA